MTTPTRAPVRRTLKGRAFSSFIALLGLAAVPVAMAQAPLTQGFLNLARTEAPGTLLSGPVANDSIDGGRTTTVAYLNGWLYVGYEQPGSRSNSDYLVRLYDISNPANPVRRRPSDFGLSYVNDWGWGNIGWNAHGVALSENYLVAGTMRVSGFGGLPERAGHQGSAPDYGRDFPFGGWNRSASAGPWQASFPWYGSPDTNFTISKRIRNAANTGWETRALATFDHVGPYGGGDWHPMFFGDLLIYARHAGAGSDGVVVYRMQYNNFEDRATMSITPQLVGTLPGGFVGYWPNLFSDGSGRLYVVGSASRQVVVADITNAATPGGDGAITLAADRVIDGLSNATYPVYQDRFAFIHHRKIDMTRLIAGDPNPIVLTLDQQANGLDTSQISLPLGNLWLTGGYHSTGRSQGMGVWVQQQAPDTTKPEIAFHIPQANRTGYPRFAPLSFLLHETPRNATLRNGVDFTVRPVGSDGSLGAFVPGFLIHDMSGVLTFNANQPLAANTTYQVNFLSNPSAQVGFRDAGGNYLDPYSFRFSTGGGVNAAPPPVISSVTATNYQPAPGGSTTITANATGTGLTYRFNFNGTWTSWSGTNTASFTYAAAGRQRVLIQVRNAEGTVVTSSANILVMTPPAGPFPTQSSTLAAGVDGTTRRVWTVNPDSDTVTVINAATGARVAEYAVGKNPRGIARDVNGRYWVTLHGDDQIRILNNNGTVFQTLSTGYGSAPFGIAPSPDGTSMFVTLYGSGRLQRYSVANPTAPVTSTATVPTARAIAVSGNGARVFVTRFISDEVNGEVHEFNGTSAGLSFTRLIRLFYDNTPDAGDRGAGVPNYVSSIAISPNGGHALYTAKKDNVHRGEFFGVGDLNHENTVRAMLGVINLATNAEQYTSRRDFDNAESPSAVTFSPRGDMALVALQGNNVVVGLDTLSLGDPVNGPALISFELGTGLAPQGVLVDGPSRRVFTQNFMGRSVTVLNGTNFLDQNNTSFPVLATTATVSNELLAPQVLQGKRIFYDASDPRMSAEGYMSCASCHADGGHDGRRWDFTGRGEGLRRTTDLRGRAGTGHGNLHWSANFDEIQDFEHDIRGAFGGQGFLPLTPTQFAAQHPTPASTKAGLSPELDALAAYVASLNTATVPKSPHRNPEGTLTEAALRGRTVMDAMGCMVCHAGTKFTDSSTSPISLASLDNVGTLHAASGSRLGALLSGIDVPTLLGLHASRLYLHHGQAATLAEVFNLTGGNLLEAESATPLWVNTADAVRFRFHLPAQGGGGWDSGAYEGGRAELRPDGTAQGGIRFSNVQGGPGGSARLGIRYAMQFGSGTIRLRVNSVSTTHPALQMLSDSESLSGWRWLYVDVNLNSGTNNVIEIYRDGGRNVHIDTLLVANAGHLADATHRQVLTRTPAEQSDLLAYLRQLDGRDAAGILVVDEPAGGTAGLVGRWTFEGNTQDVSGVSGISGTLASGATLSTSVSGQGSGSLNLTAPGAHMTVNGFIRPTVGFTYSMWVRPAADLTSTSPRQDLVYGISGSVRPHITFNQNTGAGAGRVGAFFSIGGSDSQVYSAARTWSANRWYHLSVTYDGAAVKIFVDGVEEGSVARTGVAAASTGLIIGARDLAGSNRFNGHLDDLSVYDGSPPATTVAADLAGRWAFDGNTQDVSGVSGISGTLAGGATLSSTVFGQGSGSLNLTGNGAHMTIAGFTRPTAGFTYAMWVRPAVNLTSTSPRQDLTFGISGSVRPHITFNQNTTAGAGRVGIFFSIGGSDSQVYSAARTWNANQWYHLAFTYDGTAVKVFVDGVEEGSVARTGAAAASTGMIIGARDTVGGNRFNGHIDDLRIYSRGLGAGEIATLNGGAAFADNLMTPSGLPFLLAYATGIDPHLPGAGAQAAVLVHDPVEPVALNFRFRHNPSAADVVLRVESSINLDDWSAVVWTSQGGVLAEGVALTTEIHDDQIHSHTLRVPFESARLFLRLQAQRT